MLVVFLSALTYMASLKTYIVEDSPVIRDSLIATLEELTTIKVVGTAEDESSALRWLLHPQHEVDLVIIDIFLKAGSGLGVLRAASGMPNGAKRVVLSNYATVDMRRKCLAMGADRVFDKSHDIDALIAYCAALSDLQKPDTGEADQRNGADGAPPK